MRQTARNNRKGQRARLIALCAPVLIIVGLSQPALAAPGSLDATFGSGGKVTTQIGFHVSANSLAIQSDGKIVVAGQTTNGGGEDFALARYNTNGSLDTSFSGNGKVTTSIGSSNDGAESVAIQTNGKIVVGGYSVIGNNTVFALARYDTNGSLDTSFSGNGKLTTSIGSNSAANSIAIQSDGKIVAAGQALIGNNNTFALARYKTHGGLDTSFSGNGKVATSIGPYAIANSVAIQSDGKIVAAGQALIGTHDRFAVARYKANGNLDTSFSGDGKLTTSIGPNNAPASSVAIQSDGKIVVAGNTYNGSNTVFALARYNTNGSLDASFSGNGKVTTSINSGASASSVAIQSDGKIVAAGYAFNGSNSLFALTRYNTNGSLDASFSGNGKVTTSINSDASASSVAIQPSDGKIVAAGYAFSGGNYKFALARYDV